MRPGLVISSTMRFTPSTRSPDATQMDSALISACAARAAAFIFIGVPPFSREPFPCPIPFPPSPLRAAFRPAHVQRPFEPQRMMYGRVESAAGEILDEALAVFMPGPHSYTRENVAEIH